MNIIRNQLPPAVSQGYVAIDSEWWALNLKTIHRPTSGRFACLTIATSPDDVYWISDPQLVEPALQRVNDAVWLIHNGKFDFTHLRRICPIPDRTKFVDTMLMERIMYGGYYDRFSEDDLVRRYLSQYMDKTLQKSFNEDLGEMSDAQVEYACLDPHLLLKVWGEQKKHITKNDMMIWKTVDLPVLWAVLDMQGFRLDVKKWEELAKLHRQQAEEINASLPFNPNSWQQVKKTLQGAGFKGLPDTNEKTINKYIKKYPKTEAARLALLMQESRGLSRRASNYGMNFIDNYLEDGDLIFSNWNVIEASTSRMSADSPSMQNIPVRETPVFRESFIAREGNVIVDADYSQQEYFVSTYVSGDLKMKEICNSGQDVYIRNAKVMYGVDINKQDILRKRMKAIVLGIDYGLTEYGLAAKEDITLEEAAKFISDFHHAFPTFSRWMERQRREKNYVETVLGRRLHLNRYSQKCENNALNAPIQGTASDMLKKAIGAIRKGWDFGCPFGLVAPVHDELVFDVPKEVAPDVARFVTSEMERVANEMCPGLKFRADVASGNSWSCKE